MARWINRLQSYDCSIEHRKNLAMEMRMRCPAVPVIWNADIAQRGSGQRRRYRYSVNDNDNDTRLGSEGTTKILARRSTVETGIHGVEINKRRKPSCKGIRVLGTVEEFKVSVCCFT